MSGPTRDGTDPGSICYLLGMTQDAPDPPDPSRLPSLVIEIEREDDGRYLAEIPALPGVMAYGATESEAVARTKALALRVLAERLEHGETAPEIAMLFRAA